MRHYKSHFGTRNHHRRLSRTLWFAAVFILIAALTASAQYYKSELPPPAPGPAAPPPLPEIDSIMLPSPVQQTVPQNYEELMGQQFAADLATPSNVKTVTEFDPSTGCYIIRTRVATST